MLSILRFRLTDASALDRYMLCERLRDRRLGNQEPVISMTTKTPRASGLHAGKIKTSNRILDAKSTGLRRGHETVIFFGNGQELINTSSDLPQLNIERQPFDCDTDRV